jgi:DNA-binding beta-propeller fold protein YncE
LIGMAALAALPMSTAGATQTAAPATDLLVSSFRTNAVMRYDGATGAFLNVLIPSDPALNGGLTGPEGLAIGPDGNLYVSSFDPTFTRPGAVLRYNAKTGAYIDAFVPPDPAKSGGLFAPTGLLFGPDGNLYVGSALTNAVLRYDGKTGAFLGVFASGGGLNGPNGMLFGPDGSLYVASLNFDVPHNMEYPGAVLRYDGKTGAFIDAFVPPDPARNGGLQRTAGLAFGPDGDLYVSSGDLMPKGSVLRYDGKTGAFKSIFVAPGKPDEPFGVVFGPDGDLYVGMAGGSARGATGDGSVMRYDSKTGELMNAFVPADAAKNGGLTGSTYLIFVPKPAP